MNTSTPSPVGLPLWSRQRGPLLLVVIHVLFVAVAAALPINALAPSMRDAAIIVLLSLAIGGLQLRHSLAMARGMHPSGWMWTFAAVLALAYIPLWWFGSDWLVHQWFAAASSAMLLRGRLAVLGVTVPILGPVIASVASQLPTVTGGILEFVALALYLLTIYIIAPAALYWSARLVRMIDELFAARAEMAEVAIAGERWRVSRDLHDLLGQSLSAVSLKGDLAIRLLQTDRSAALAEIESLTGVARGALRDVRAVALAEHDVSLQAEIDGAAVLLGAAGIDVHLDLDPLQLAGQVEQLLAWVVREGTTNILRHSEARHCWVTAGRRDGTVRLEIVNDGAQAPIGEGSGLAGLTERARRLSGSVSAGPSPGGRFRLVVEVPVERS